MDDNAIALGARRALESVVLTDDSSEAAPGDDGFYAADALAKLGAWAAALAALWDLVKAQKQAADEAEAAAEAEDD